MAKKPKPTSNKKEDIQVTLQKLANNSAKTLQTLANEAQVKVQELANEATEKSFAYNSAEAEKNRKWQEEMSNTSHQREVADLKAAGLNPVLSANQGAMSYTSSSANAQAESGANASGSIASGLVGSMAGLAESSMNNRANIHQTNVSAAAQKAAAASAAAATRAAAAASAAATRYAADRNFQTQEMAWKYKYKIEKYRIKNAPQGSIAGVIDKHLGNTGIPSRVTAAVKKYFGNVGTQNLFASYKNTSNWKLNTLGKAKVNASLSSMGVAKTAFNQSMFVKAFIFGNKSAQNYIRRQRFATRITPHI